MNTDNIIDAARSALGSPFRHQGRDVVTGLDCVGLLIHIAKTLEIPHKDREVYARIPNNGQLEETLSNQSMLEEVVGPLQKGDILLMRFSKEPQHVAIYVGDTIIHSYLTIGKVCEHGLTDIWKNRIIKAYRIKGLDNE